MTNIFNLSLIHTQDWNLPCPLKKFIFYCYRSYVRRGHKFTLTICHDQFQPGSFLRLAVNHSKPRLREKAVKVCEKHKPVTQNDKHDRGFILDISTSLPLEYTQDPDTDKLSAKVSKFLKYYFWHRLK